MKKIFYHLLFIIIIIITSCHNSRTTENDLISFDYYKSYPEIDLKLSDVAEVTYIPLKKGKQEYILPGGNMWNNLYIDEVSHKIYFLQKRKIYVYDLEGNPLQILDKEGRGPEECLFMTRFWMEKDNNAICAYDGMGKTLAIYDTLFNFKKKIAFIAPPLDCMIRIKGDTLVTYNHPAVFDSKDKARYPDMQKEYVNFPPFFFTFSYTDSRVIQTIPYQIERPMRDVIEGPEFLLYPNIIRGLNGLFMTNKCCDTVLWMNANTMEVTPRFIDVTDYHTPECMTIPSFETEKYLFFDTHFAPKLSPNIKKKYFLYDKANKKIFQIKARAYEPLRNTLGLLNDECALTSTLSTQNDNYAATFVQPLFLLENRENLPPELLPMVDTLHENDNPVLMLIKLKK